MIVITGATGGLGSAIIAKLLDIIPADQIIASTRDALAATDITERGVSVRQANYDDLESLEAAFKGARQVLLISSNIGAFGGDPVAQHARVIEAAKNAGVKRIVYTSHMAASAGSAFPPMRDHAKTEALLAASGLSWTALRNGFYGASGVTMIADAFETGSLETVQDGKFSWVAHGDLAQAAAIILAEEDKFDGPTPPLTGAQALDFGDLIRIAAKAKGKAMVRSIVTEKAMSEKLIRLKVPAPVIDIILGLYKASANGEFAEIDPTLEGLIGRAPISMKEQIEQEVGK